MKYAYPVVLLCLVSVANAEDSAVPVPDKVMGANAVEIMTQGTVIDTQFSNEHIGSDLADPIFLRWRSLINFRDKIFVCHVQQMVLHDVDHAPSASCIEAS